MNLATIAVGVGLEPLSQLDAFLLQVFGVNNDLFVTQLLNGLVLGMIFVLVSFGLSIIFGLMGIINFAHGDLLIVGTYVSWATVMSTNSLLAGVVLGTVSVAAIGFVTERLLMGRIYDRDPLLQLLLTFGLAEVIREFIRIIWGPTGKSFPTPGWGTGSFQFSGISYPRYRLYLILITLLIVVVVYLLIHRTNTGLIIRAATEDREMVDSLGINIRHIFTIVFVLGSVLAGLAGGLIGPIRGAYPTLGIDLLIPSFVVVVVGGIGSLRGTVIAGIIIGQVVVMMGLFAPRLSQISIFGLLALVLLVRPAGLFGRTGVFE